MSSSSSMEGVAKVGGIDRISLSEILVDFFGSLVPGLIFVVALVGLSGLTLITCLNLCSRLLDVNSSFDANSAVQSVGSLLSPYWLGVFFFILMLSFVAGHFFFRQDPREPDEASFKKITSKMPSEDLERWVVCNKKKYGEFPYPNLRSYLESRGLNHLAQLVNWRDGEFRATALPQGSFDDVRRTKNFINILKIRLAFHFPEKLGAITRNEAHIRLMSSTWYMVRELRNVSCIALLFSSASLVWAMSLWEYRHYQIRVLVYVVPVIVPFALLVISLRARFIINKFLHYQRVREIVFVLETAYTAFTDRPELLKDICPDFKP